MPKVILAKHAGFCFGVKRAVDKALELAKQYGKIYTIGDLIHNPDEVERLSKNGVISVEKISQIPRGGIAVIRSHGVVPEIYLELERCEIKYFDLTCPFVSRIHDKVKKEGKDYDATIIVGAKDHPEVIGIEGWAGDNAVIIEDEKQAQGLCGDSALVVAQTTISPEVFQKVCDRLKNNYKYVDVFDSICKTTQLRQAEAAKLAKISDMVVVVGGKNSSNTAKLAKISSQYCKKVQYIQSKSELSLENFSGCDIISIVAGASTPDWIIREVNTQMSEVEKAQVLEQTETVQAEPVQTEPVAEVASQEAAAPVEEAIAQEAEVAAEEPAKEEAVQTEVPETAKDDNSVFLEELEKTFKKIRRGQFVTGVVVQVSDDEVCVNIGYKSDGIIKKEDCTVEGNVSPAELFKIGDEIEAEVISLNDGQGNVSLSRKKIENQQKWKNLVEEIDMDAVYTVKVAKVIKGGVLSKLDGYDAFIPASQLSLKYVEDLNVFQGKELEVKIIDIDKRQKRFVLSHKEVLKAQKEAAEKQLFESFEKGAVVKGVVKRITDFGAFVDVGGVDGLLHITDISWTRIKTPKDVLSENQEIEVKILNVDPEKKKISLGYKQLQPKPWDLAPQKYIVGETVTGKVVRIAPFGAFVELEPTIDGLIHISQVANRRIEKVEDVLTQGQEVTAKILEVNPEKKRISLSIRALIQDEKPAEEDREKTADEGEARPERPNRRRERDAEKIDYTIPPVEEAKTSLADIFNAIQD